MRSLCSGDVPGGSAKRSGVVGRLRRMTTTIDLNDTDSPARARLSGSAADRFDQFCDLLGDVRIHDDGTQGSGTCPACDGSLSVTFDARGIAVHCHAYEECATEEIVGVYGLVPADLFGDDTDRPSDARERDAAKRRATADEGEVRLLRPALVEMTGTIESALLLGQLIFWMPHATYRRNGHRWVAKSYKEWEYELYLSEHKANKAVRNLRDLGVIQTNEWAFAGKKVLFFRIVGDRYDELFEAGVAGAAERKKAWEESRRTNPE